MLGKSHLLVGSCSYLLLAPPLMNFLDISYSTTELACGTVLCAGTSMLPDLDHPQATIARSLGVVTKKIAQFVALVSGGHRNGTHSLLAVLLMSCLLSWAFARSDSAIIQLVLCTFFVSLAVNVLFNASWLVGFIMSFFVAATLTSVAPGGQWITIAVLLGMLFHMMADALTPEGVPLFWPFSKKRFSLHVIITTGNLQEKVIASVCGLLAAWLMISNVFVPVWRESHSVSPQAESRSCSHLKNNIKSVKGFKNKKAVLSLCKNKQY